MSACAGRHVTRGDDRYLRAARDADLFHPRPAHSTSAPGETMLTKQFWADAFERAVKTAAQSAVAAIGTTALIQSIDWSIVGGTVGVATLLSVLTSVGSAAVGDPDSASLLGGEAE